MDVTNATWQQAGGLTPATLVVQNVGNSRIAFVFAAAAPAVGALDLDGSEHGILLPGSGPVTITNLAAETLQCYVRALGPIDGKLFVHSDT